MSSISPLGPQPAAVSGVEPASYLSGTLDGVAGMLSMSTSDLQSALKSGSSIADLASSKGVSLSSIVQNIEQQVQQQQAAQGKPPIDQSVLDASVNRAVQRHRGGHHHHQSAPAQTDQTDPSTSSSSIAPTSSSTGSFLDLLA